LYDPLTHSFAIGPHNRSAKNLKKICEAIGGVCSKKPQLVDATWHSIELHIIPGAVGAEVVLHIDHGAVAISLFLQDYSLATPSFLEFTASTRNASNHHWIRNIRVRTVKAAQKDQPHRNYDNEVDQYGSNVVKYAPCTYGTAELGFRTFYTTPMINGMSLGFYAQPRDLHLPAQDSSSASKLGVMRGLADGGAGTAKLGRVAPHGLQFYTMTVEAGFAHVLVDAVDVSDYMDVQMGCWIRAESRKFLGSSSERTFIYRFGYHWLEQ
jgi:hypothetical protein